MTNENHEIREEVPEAQAAEHAPAVRLPGMVVPPPLRIPLAGPAGPGLPPSEDPVVMRVMSTALAMAQGMGIDGKAAVRRVVGLSEWRSDPERVEAAEAKRERKRLKRAARAD